MTSEQYSNERSRLLVVLEDAKDRGDYHLEMDCIELLNELDETYNGDHTMS